MYRILVTAILAALCTTGIAHGEECTPSVYEGLVIEAKNADANRLWDSSEALYRRILDECLAMVAPGELPRLHDALAVSLLMQEKYGDAIEAARRCLEQDGRYNACMLTAAKGYDALGDTGEAARFASDAIETGASDEYSAAVVIDAKSFLRSLEKKQPR